MTFVVGAPLNPNKQGATSPYFALSRPSLVSRREVARAGSRSQRHSCSMSSRRRNEGVGCGLHKTPRCTCPTRLPPCHLGNRWTLRVYGAVSFRVFPDKTAAAWHSIRMSPILFVSCLRLLSSTCTFVPVCLSVRCGLLALSWSLRCTLVVFVVSVDIFSCLPIRFLVLQS